MADEWKAYPAGPAGIAIVSEFTQSDPHPYCITPKHLADEDGMYLDEARIKRAEGRGAVCDTCKHLTRGSWKERKQERILKYDEHKSEKALVLGIPGYTQPELNAKLNEGWSSIHPDLQPWLLTIKSRMESDGYAGMAIKAMGV